MATPLLAGTFSVNRAGLMSCFPQRTRGVAPRALRAWSAPQRRAARGERRGARDERLMALLPLVKQMALGIRSRLPAHVELDDLIGDGVLGLMDAVDKFDASRRVKLACYARYRIRGAILDGLRHLDPITREGRKKQRKLKQIRQDLVVRRGRPVGDEDMAEALGVSLARWFQLQQEIHRLGVEAQPWEEWNGRPADGEAGLAAEFTTPFDLCYRREQREILRRSLATLPERQRLIVSLYDLRGMTMKQIALQLRVDESRISQLHSAALRGLQERARVFLKHHQPAADAPSCSPIRAAV